MEKYKDPSLSFEERAQALTDEMTFDEQVTQISYGAGQISRLSVPAYNWWNEGLHGVARAGTATMFPQAIGMAAMFDE
ncbi:MAG TPA: glycoside hydrolase family 3 protein, partial [Bacillota bacterium]|nr:glycoside hydrolase family 3 protein [Bacillota bacterium]